MRIKRRIFGLTMITTLALSVLPVFGKSMSFEEYFLGGKIYYNMDAKAIKSFWTHSMDYHIDMNGSWNDKRTAVWFEYSVESDGENNYGETSYTNRFVRRGSISSSFSDSFKCSSGAHRGIGITVIEQNGRVHDLYAGD